MHAPPSARRRSARPHLRHLPSRPSRPLALLAALVVLAACSVVAVQTAAARAPQASGRTHAVGRLKTLEPQVFAAINEFRRQHGLAPLRLSRALTIVAASHSLSMAEHGYFEHTSFDGSPFWKRVATVYPRKGRRWSVGENLVWAAPGLSARRALALWLASPSHRETLLSPAWREVGLGAVRAFAGGVFQGRMVTILTADFGVRR
jgi:uncharacterized protein YkwD